MLTTGSSPEGFSRLEEFNRYFKLSPAITREQRSQVYQIRYRVYCEEFGYEPTSVLGNHQEMDEFDCQSIHCLVTHRKTGVPVGCVRVVMVEGNDMMPMEAHSGHSIDRHFIAKFRDQRETLCEISRLAVESSFRRRHRERQTRFGDIDSLNFTALERRTFPLIALALILGAGAVADILNRKNCFAIMEPFLPAMLKRVGINFRRVGTDFEFRGVRAPYYGNMDELTGNAPPELCLYFNAVREHFAAVLRSLPNVAAPSAPDLSKMVGTRASLSWGPTSPRVGFA